MDVKFTDHSQEIIEQMHSKVEQALIAIGATAESHAKEICPVGTPESTGIPGYIGGTLRNSITHSVDMDEQAVYIGTNVEYGKWVENGSSKRKPKPFLKPAATEHNAEYEALAKQALNT